MSRLLLLISIALALLYAFPTEAQVAPPWRGGTGTATAPAYGQVLIGDGTGVYKIVATSSLGIQSGLSSLNGLTGGAQTFATSSDANILIRIVSIGTAHTFYPEWTGVLSVPRGGTGSSSPSQFLFGTGAEIVSTSTIAQNFIDSAIARVAQLAGYLSLSSWYATTTDALQEGTANRYFTDGRADARARAVINASTSIPQEPGQAFGDLLRWSGSRWLGVATSTLGIFWNDVRNIPAGFADGVDDAFSTTSADYWDNTKTRWATSSSDYWLTTKSTSNLTEGSNLYYTLARFASALAGTTTNALSEGSTNKYYTDARVGSYISGSSTIPHTGGSAWGDLLRWTGSAWSAIATSTLGIAWGDLRGVPAGFADGTDDVGSAPTWGSITGTLSNQTDLQTALNAKVNNSTTTLPLLSTLPGLVSFGSSTATTTALGNLTAIGYVQLGTTTTAMLNGVIVVDGVNYPQTQAGAQNAINVCAAFPTTCSGVFLPNVVWPPFTSPLALKSGVDIHGASTTLVSSMTELGSHRGIFTITNQQDITIDGFNFIVTGSSTAITSYGHDSLTIQNNSFTGSSTGSGAAGVIALEGNSASADFNNTTIQGNRFYAMPTSQRVVYLYSRSGNVITNTKVFNNHFDGTRGPAVYLDDYDTITGTIVTNNTFTNLTSGSASTAPGVALFAGLAGLNNLIHDVTFSNNQYHNSVTTAGQQQGLVYIYSASGIVIDNNIAVGAWTPAVRVIGPAIAPGRTTTPVNGMTITNNHIEGFDAAWDPDSMRNVEVANNVVRNSGHGFNVGYGTQEYVNIHDNTTYNSTHYLYHSQLLFGASTPRKVRVANNTYIDETSPATTTRAMFFTGHHDFSDVTVERNRFFFPNGTPSLTAKEFGDEKLPVVFRENEIETSAGITRNGPWLSNGNILFLGATTTGTGTTTNGLTMGDLAFYWDNAAKRLGVGTNAPSAILSVTATSSVTDAIRVVAPQDGYWLDGYVGSTQYFGLRQRSGYIEMQSFASTPLALNPQGNNVSVGVSTGSSKLTISGNTSIGSGYTGVAAPTNGLIVEGKTGIGTSSPYAPLSVVGSGGVVAEKYNATGTTATSTFAGDVTVSNRLVISTTTLPTTTNGPFSGGRGFGNFVMSCDACSSTFGNVLGIANFGSGGAGVNTWSARGSQTAPSATQSGDNLYFMGGRGFGSTVWNVGSKAAIQMKANQAFTDTANGTYITLETTPDNSTTRAERLRVDNNGNVGIGTSTPYAALSVVGSTGVVAEKYNATGTATSTFAWDINLASGHCIQYNGSCISLGGGGLSGGTANMLAAWTSGSAITATGTPAVTAINATTTTATSTFAGNISLTGFGYFGTTSVAMLNGTIYADRMPGADIGAKINNAYAFLPSSGGTVVVPGGSYTYSTAISFSTADKPVLLSCSPDGSTKLTYSGSATSTTLNFGAEGITSNVHHGAGIEGCTFVGNGTTTGVGIQIGGSNGAEGVVLDRVTVQNYKIGLGTSNNLWLASINNSNFNHNGQNFVWYGGGNAGEGIDIVNTSFADSDSASTTNHYYQCFDLSRGSVASITVTGGAFDDCQIYAGNGTTLTLNGVHFENPAGDGTGNMYIPIYFDPSEYSTLNINGGTWVQGATAQMPPYFLYNGGNATINGFTVRDSGGGVVDFFAHNDNTNSGGSLSIHGLTNVGGSGFAAVTDLDPTSLGITADGNRYIQAYIQTQNSYPYVQQLTNYNTLFFFNANYQVMTFGFDGNVGIGTTTPQAKLEVSTPNATNAMIYLTQIGASYFRLKAQDTKTRLTFNNNLLFDINEAGKSIFGIGSTTHIMWGFDDTTSVGTCGTSPKINGNDVSGTVTFGTGSLAACTVTFKNTYTNTPRCFGNLIPKDSNATATVMVIVPSATNFIAKSSASNIGGSKFDYFCSASSTPTSMF